MLAILFLALCVLILQVRVWYIYIYTHTHHTHTHTHTGSLFSAWRCPIVICMHSDDDHVIYANWRLALNLRCFVHLNDSFGHYLNNTVKNDTKILGRCALDNTASSSFNVI